MKLKRTKGMSASCRLYTYPYGEGNLQVVEQFPELDTILLDTCYMTLRHTEKSYINDLAIQTPSGTSIMFIMVLYLILMEGLRQGRCITRLTCAFIIIN